MATRNPEEVRRAAREILNQPQFDQPADSIWSDIAEAVLDPVGTISRALNWLLSGTQFATAGSPVLAWVIVAVAAMVIILIIVRLTQTLVPDDVAAVRVAPDAGTVSGRELLEQAAEAEAQGNWRSSLRLRYSALIAELDDQGLVKRRPGRTTGEYVRQVQANAPEAAPSFEAATDIFDFVWYGDGTADEESVNRFRALAEAAGRMVAA